MASSTAFQKMHGTSVSPFRVLTAALFCEAVAGIQYWWPALLTTLQPHLHLTLTQSLFLSATINSGDTLAIPAGFFHSRYGSRKTSLLGSVVLALSFVFLSLLPLLPSNAIFPAAFIITATVNVSAYALYSASITIASAVFPDFYRGRVVGLLTAAYAASAAIYAALQSAFFTDPSCSTALLLTCATISATASVLVALFFPSEDTFATEPAEQHQQPSYGTLQPIPALPFDHQSHTVSRISFSYALIWCFAIVLQLAAVTDLLSGPHFLLQTFALAPLALMAVLLIRVPHASPIRVHPKPPTILAHSDSLLSVANDSRFQYFALGRFLVIGGGGITLLVQSHNIMSSRLALSDPTAIPGAVRTTVMLFSAFNLTSRLIVGMTMDASTPQASHMRKYNILHLVSLIMALTLPMISLLPTWGLYLSIAVVGMCHGAFFTSTPALITQWFGVRQFPRNWSASGPFQLLASFCLASALPAVMMSSFGTWVEQNGEAVCVGAMCTLPFFLLISMLDLMLYALGWVVRQRVLHCASESS